MDEASHDSASKPKQKRKRNRRPKRMSKGAANSCHDAIRHKLLEDKKFDEFAAIEDQKQREQAIRAWVSKLDLKDGLWRGLAVNTNADLVRLGTAAVFVVNLMIESDQDAKGTQLTEERTLDDLTLAAITSAQRLQRTKNPAPEFVTARRDELTSLTPKTFVAASGIPGAGAGLLARVDMKKGEIAATYGGTIVNSKPNITGRCIQLCRKRQRYLDCNTASSSNAASYANTAHLPGCSGSEDATRKNNTVLCVTPTSASLKTKVAIKRGQELLVPYGKGF